MPVVVEPAFVAGSLLAEGRASGSFVLKVVEGKEILLIFMFKQSHVHLFTSFLIHLAREPRARD